MKLEEILITIDDNTNVVVVDAENGNTLAEYNGKDAIPTTLNVCEVATMRVDENHLVISIINEFPHLKS